ncbi:hypothetical protein WLF18_03700 [Pseudomonas shirazensis]|uniref:Uncharacterized protein n=2 Tax=Pseudomonas TaxID=286 RepID=A0A2S3WDW9_PSEPU|nr:hypothetical protein [Pseudomonas putida]POF89164.1 hypothetical protein BGP80_14795 [Pseudomonas putida]
MDDTILAGEDARDHIWKQFSFTEIFCVLTYQVLAAIVGVIAERAAALTKRCGRPISAERG